MELNYNLSRLDVRLLNIPAECHSLGLSVEVLLQELQEGLKSFLDLACHCDIYDLFDDALFDTIALDPSGWLEEFVNDKDVKIIIVSSIGEQEENSIEQPIYTTLIIAL